MALFKICRGNEENLPTTLTDGYAYFCADTGSFYIDYTDSEGNLARRMIKAEYANSAGTASIADKAKAVYDASNGGLGAKGFSAYGYEMSQMVKRGRYEDLLDRPFGDVPTIYETDENGNIDDIYPLDFTGISQIFPVYGFGEDVAPLCISASIDNVSSPVRGANYIFTLDGVEHPCTATYLPDVSRTLEDGSVQSANYDDSDANAVLYFWGNWGLTGLPSLNSDTNYSGENTGEPYLITWAQGNLTIYIANELKEAYFGQHPASSLVPAEEYFTIDEKYLPECVVTEMSLANKGFATQSYVDAAVANAGGGSGGGASVQADWAQNDDTQTDYVKNRPGGYVTQGSETYTFDGNFEGREYIRHACAENAYYYFLRIADSIDNPNRLIGTLCTLGLYVDSPDSEPQQSMSAYFNGVSDYSDYFGYEDGTIFLSISASIDTVLINLTRDCDVAPILNALFGTEVESVPARSGLYTMNATITETSTDEEGVETETTTQYILTTLVIIPETIAKIPAKFIKQDAPGGYWFDGAMYTYDGNPDGKHTTMQQITGSTKTYEITYVRVSEDVFPSTFSCDVAFGDGSITNISLDSYVDDDGNLVAAIGDYAIVVYHDFSVVDVGLSFKKGVYFVDETETTTETGESERVYTTQLIVQPGMARWPSAMLESRVVAENYTLYSSNWVGTSAPYSYSLTASGLTAEDDGMIGLGKSATVTQAEAARNAMIRVTGQTSNVLTLAADGTKPTVDIPVTVIIL